MRLSELRDAKVRTLDGETLGRVHEVHVEDGRVVALTCGAGSFIERLTARKHGRRIPWECVRQSHAQGGRRRPRPPAAERHEAERPSKPARHSATQRAAVKALRSVESSGGSHSVRSITRTRGSEARWRTA